MKDNMASRLKQYITIEDPVYTSDLLGGFITAWNDYALLWAEIIPQGKANRLSAEKRAGANIYKITMRYIPGVTEKMRVRHKSKYYSIRSVTNIEERDEKLEIIATDGVR